MLTSGEGTGLWNNERQNTGTNGGGESCRGPHNKQASTFCSPTEFLHLNNDKTKVDIFGVRTEKDKNINGPSSLSLKTQKSI